jgi:hypothetical protein
MRAREEEDNGEQSPEPRARRTGLTGQVRPLAFDAGPPCQQNFRPHALAPLLTVKFLQPSHEFTFGVGISFIPYSLVLTPLV